MHLYERDVQAAEKVLNYASPEAAFDPDRCIRTIEPTIASFVDFEQFFQYLIYARNHGFELEDRRVADQSN